MPVLLQGRDDREEAEQFAERIAAAHAAGMAAGGHRRAVPGEVPHASIEQALGRRKLPVQSMNIQAPRRFDWRQPSVKLLTMHSAKGLEFPLVFVAGLQALPRKDESLEDAARLVYVAMTRATHELVLATCGKSPIVERVREALGEVGRRFAEG